MTLLLYIHQDHTQASEMLKRDLPYLEFGNVFLLNCSEGDIDIIQKTQNKCLRNILGKDRMYRTEQLHRDARLETWKVRALTAAMKLMFKYKFNTSNLREGVENEGRVTRALMGPIFRLEHPISRTLIPIIVCISFQEGMESITSVHQKY